MARNKDSIDLYLYFRYIVPIKEQCGVKNPYIPVYDQEQGLNRVS